MREEGIMTNTTLMIDVVMTQGKDIDLTTKEHLTTEGDLTSMKRAKNQPTNQEYHIAYFQEKGSITKTPITTKD